MRYKQVVFLGMHRTNSSFIASWFQACGLDVGDDLLEPSAYNKKGYFEDKDFVALHKEIFNFYEIDITGLFKSQGLKNVDPEFTHKAKKLVSDRNQRKAIWGFKDPRTCLVYQVLYRQLLSSPFLIVTYRPPREVVNSILNREFKISGKDLFKKLLLKPRQAFYHLFIYPRIILKAWINYNREILDIVGKANREAYIVLSRQGVLADHAQIIRHLNQKGLALRPADPAQLFDKSYLSRKPHPYFLSPLLLRKAYTIEKRLKKVLF